MTPRTALVTGGSAGLGLALVTALAADGWTVVTDARSAPRLAEATSGLGPRILAVPGDVTDPTHRAHLAELVGTTGRLDLLVNNASSLGAPLGPLAQLEAATFDELWLTNVAAPLALTQLLLPTLLASRGMVIDLSSDAAVEHYETWGGYAATKAALDHLTLTLAAENPGLAAYAVDPGDLRTAMHQAAFPGEDISDRPLPQAVVPAFLRLVAERPPSGRYRAADLLSAERASA